MYPASQQGLYITASHHPVNWYDEYIFVAPTCIVWRYEPGAREALALVSQHFLYDLVGIEP